MGCTEGFNDPSADPLRSSGDDRNFAQIPERHVESDEEKRVFKNPELVFELKVPAAVCSAAFRDVGNHILQSESRGKVRKLDKKKKLLVSQDTKVHDEAEKINNCHVTGVFARVSLNTQRKKRGILNKVIFFFQTLPVIHFIRGHLHMFTLFNQKKTRV